MNPITIAQFFKAICIGIFKHLLAVKSNHRGFLGLVSIYFRTVETNGHGILHLYCFIWLCEAHHQSEIREQLYFDLVYAEKMVEFIDNIIQYSIDSTLQGKPLSQETPSTSLDRNNKNFVLKLYRDSTFIITRCQLHSSTHNVTCFKHSATAIEQCQFHFLRP